MDIYRKKIIIIPLKELVGTASGKERLEDVTDFRIRKEMLDRLCELKSISWVLVTHDMDEKEYQPQLKAVEFFAFVYCKTAVACKSYGDNIMEWLPYNIRKTDVMLSVGDKKISETYGVDFISVGDFLCMQ